MNTESIESGAVPEEASDPGPRGATEERRHEYRAPLQPLTDRVARISNEGLDEIGDDKFDHFLENRTIDEQIEAEKLMRTRREFRRFRRPPSDDSADR